MRAFILPNKLQRGMLRQLGVRRLFLLLDPLDLAQEVLKASAQHGHHESDEHVQARAIARLAYRQYARPKKLPWTLLLILGLLLLLLFSVKAHAQAPFILEVRNAGVTLKTWSGGRAILNFSGATVSCAGAPVVCTVTVTGGPGGGVTSWNGQTGVVTYTQVQPDWNAISGVGQILNKPTLFDGAYASLTGKPTLFDGTYASLSGKPTIPAAQIQSDWTQATTSALDFIKNKPILFDGTYASLTGKPTLGTIASHATTEYVAVGTATWPSSGTVLTDASTIAAAKVSGNIGGNAASITGTITKSQVSDFPVIPAAGAPTTSTYIVQTADAGLSGEQVLGSLGTGILKNTTTTGVLSIAIAGDFPTLNQNTSGTASNVSGTPALPNGTTATTQTAGDNSTKLATTAYVEAQTPRNYEVAADWSTSSTTFSNITGLGWAIGASATQTFDCYLGVQDASTTVGVMLGFTGPASPTAVTYMANLQLTVQGTVTNQAATAASFPTAIPTTACTSSCVVGFKLWRLTGIIKNGTNAGTVQLQGKVASGTGKIQAASACWVH